MKKLVIVAVMLMAFALSASAATSPIDKGSWFLGGTLSFKSAGGDLYKIGGKSQTLITLSPSFGYFITPGLIVGAEVQYNRLKVDTNKTTNYGAGPMVGYYFNINKTRTEIKGSIYPYVKGAFLYMKEKIDEGSTTVLDAHTTSFVGSIGADYMLSEAVALDLAFQIQTDSYKLKDATSSVSGTQFMIGAGVTYFIWK